MTSRKTQKTKTKMALLALPFFDFSIFSKLFGGPLNSDYILAILLVFLAFFSLWFALIFFQKIHKASPRLFYFLSLTLILGGFAYGTDRFIQRELDFEQVGIQIPKRIETAAVLGESDSEIREESAGPGIFEGANLEEFLTIAGISQNEKGDPHGALQVRNNRIKIKTGRVSSRAIKDETIRDEDIDDDIKLHVQDLFVSRNVEIDGTATFQNGASISGGNLTVSGNVVAGTVNGNTITTGTGTLTLDSFTLALSGNSEINQDLLTTSTPIFAGMTLNGNLVLGANTLTTTNTTLISNLNADMTDGFHLDQNVLTTSSPTFNTLTLSGNIGLTGTDPIWDLTTASTLNINTTNNRPVTFGTGLVTIPNLSITNSGVDNGTMTIDSDETTGSILTVTGGYLTSGTGILKNITANAGNGQVTTGEKVVLTDATVNGGGYTGISVTVNGTGTGSGNKYLLDLNPGANMQVVFDSSGAFRSTTAVASNTNTIGSPSYYWKNGYFDQITANNLSGTVVTGATSSTTWTIGSTEAGDVNEALIFQRNSGSGNATLEWRRGTNDLRYLSVNYPFNSTYTVDDSSIGTGINLFSGNLTNNTTSGTQRLMSLTNTGTGTTETGIYLSNTGTATTAIEIAGTWTNGIVTNNNSINTGTGTITGASYNGLGLTSNADGFSITGGVIPRTLSVSGEAISLVATLPTTITLPSSGTLATLAGAETFTNKVSYNGLVITANTGVITTGTWNGTSIADAYIDNNITLSNLTQLTTRSHADLQNLLVDDHTQYALLVGRAGGQTLIGGTAASNNLTLSSTSNGTKGNILFGTSAYDEVNNRLGIGTTSPTYKLHVNGTLGLESTIYAPNIGAGTDNSVLVLNSSGNVVTDEIDPDVWTPGSLLDGNGTANYVPYYSDADTLTISNIYYNGTNVGIGTTSLGARLSIVGAVSGEIFNATLSTGVNAMRIDSLGRVLVGNETSPRTSGITFETYDSDYSTASQKNIAAFRRAYDASNSAGLIISSDALGATGTTMLKSTGSASQNMGLGPTGFELYLKTGGNVGIGTTAPGAKLDVRGDLLIKETVYGVDRSLIIDVRDNDYDSIISFRRAGLDDTARILVNHNDGTSTANSLQFATGLGAPTTKMMITNGGNVGIGTTGPDRKLDILDASNPQLRLSQSDGSVYADFQVDSNGDLIMNVDGVSNQLVLDNGGNVGIGSVAPTAKLYVDQTAASNLVDFLDGGTSIFQIADGGLISMHGSITYNSASKPKRSIILTSSGATIPTSGGATQTKVDGTNHTYYVLDFGDTTDSSSFWQWTMPDSFDGGTIDVTFYWEAAATTGDVVWAAQTAGVDPDNTEDVDPTLGSAQTVTDTAQANANDLASATISSWSPSWAAGDYIVFKAYRDADAGGDTLSGNARLVKVKVEYSVSSESD